MLKFYLLFRTNSRSSSSKYPTCTSTLHKQMQNAKLQKTHPSFTLFHRMFIRPPPKSSDDHGMPPSSTILGHTSPTHLHQHQHHQHLNAVTAVNYPPHMHPGQAAGTSMTVPGAVPTTNAAGYPEDIYGTQDFNELGQSEHYIYVTYPPELKRRLLERYGREIYLMLLRKDLYD